MPELIQKRLTFVVLVIYCISTALCACRSAASDGGGTKLAAHSCCQKPQGGAPRPAPVQSDRSKQCPHCDGVMSAPAELGQTFKVSHVCGMIAAPIFATVRVVPPQGDATPEPLAPLFLPCPTLLQLHCALTT
jgi:hypothetical protein